MFGLFDRTVLKLFNFEQICKNKLNGSENYNIFTWDNNAITSRQTPRLFYD